MWYKKHTTGVIKTDKYMNIVNGLKEYGLSENESKIYLYLIEQTDANAFDISRGTKIARTTVYATLESLKSLSLINEWKKNGVAFFSPESPNRLKYLLKEKEEVLNEIMPGIQDLRGKHGKHPITKVYIGERGFQIAVNDSLEVMKQQNIRDRYVYAHPDLVKAMPNFFSRWAKEKDKMHVFSRLIVPDSPTDNSRTHHTYVPNKYREVRYIKDDRPAKHSFDITGDRLGFFSADKTNLYSVLVYSELMSETFRKFFMYVWDNIELER